ncbi:uncharacterized protein DEA37_0008076 [Paragonimus westermani]|uniref:Peptidase A2 domain-containing protein n=1 Tax=Paragonimus westermani TaxID=34504 RepID=A0A5J4N904_9TREM|nr:uncharacterized protein DEA37_0008076 [Paragonimus westermani]
MAVNYPAENQVYMFKVKALAGWSHVEGGFSEEVRIQSNQSSTPNRIFSNAGGLSFKITGSFKLIARIKKSRRFIIHPALIEVQTHVLSDALVSALAVPFAPFRGNNPKSWFAQLEAPFALQQFTSKLTRFHHVVAGLPSHVTDEVDDVLELPDSTKPYEQLKAAVSKRVGLSDRQRISQLLSATELGDRKPSQLLRHMQRLAGRTHIEEALLREMWLQRLPKDIQNVLSANPSATLSTLAEVADRIGETYGAAVSQLASNSQGAIATLTAQIATLTKQLLALTTHRSRSRSTTPIRRHSSHAGSHHESGIRYLIDTGAEVSVIPLETHDLNRSSISNLCAANGSTIKVFGQRSRTLNLGLRRPFRWIFTVADVQVAIICINFLQHFDLLVDSRRHRLVDQTTKHTVTGILTDKVSISPVYQSSSKLNSFGFPIDKYPTVFRESSSLSVVRGSTRHYLVTTGPLVFA